ncbi:MAG: glycosyltransferase, partial [Proteobacteria bacterium]|nr:glycosyltransferase [Pseudomonadota bacterium]
GLVFTGIEALSFIGTTASLLFLMRTQDRTAEVEGNLPWLKSLQKCPLIDVLICTYNEEEAILERTIIGALGIKYPNYRVWVCDDGRRAWLRALCARYDVRYLTRADNAHAKAGNINAALDVLASQERVPDFISILDADFVPMPDFLTRTMALMRDDKVGVVQTPQHFFNPDPIQSNLSLTRVFPDEQRFFFDIIMASKDAWGAAFCCGTSSLIRFNALRSIGGFPTDSVTEDYLVSLRLRQAGYATVYLNEALSLGLAPEGLAEYTGQRSRWCLGFVQICMGRSGPLRFGNNLPFVDRIMLSETFLHWAATHAFRLLSILVPASFLLFGIQAVHADVRDAISYILPLFVANAVAFGWLTQGRVMPLMADLYQLLCATEVLKAVYAGLLRPKGQKFKVTAKGGDRSKRFVQWPMLRIFLIFLALAVAGVANTFLLNSADALPESAGLALYWSWHNIAVILLACFVCIEQPRQRAADRFETREPVCVSMGDHSDYFEARDISVSGIQLAGNAPGSVGSVVNIAFGGLNIEARIVRVTYAGFALRFTQSKQNRIDVTRYIFSGRYSTTVHNITGLKVARAVGARVLG